MRMHDRWSFGARVRAERRRGVPVVRAARVWVARPARAAVAEAALWAVDLTWRCGGERCFATPKDWNLRSFQSVNFADWK